MADSKGEELISRAKAIEALHKESDRLQELTEDEYFEAIEFKPLWNRAFDVIRALPVVSSPPNGDLISELHECLAMHHTAAYDLHQDIIEILSHYPAVVSR